MATSAILVLVIIIGAVILFATEIIAIDLVAMLVMISLVLLGIISPSEGVAGFSNTATITVAAMFILSAGLLKTGGMQYVSLRLSGVFKKNFTLGIVTMMILVAFISAFINNTPVVAVFIPIVVQVAQSSNISPSKALIPLSYASIFGGTCSLIGTSTNVLVAGIMKDRGLEPFSMFDMTPMGLIFFLVGLVYMLVFGIKMLPDRKGDASLQKRFGLGDYLAEIELMKESPSVNKTIMDSPLVQDLEMDIIEVRRNTTTFPLPPGDLVLLEGDVLKIRCDVNKIKALKDNIRFNEGKSLKIGEDFFNERGTSLVELIITANSDFEGKTLKLLDFRRTFRAIPLAIKHREEVLHNRLYEVTLRAGDVILAEVKTHHLDNLKELQRQPDHPMIILSEDGIVDFQRNKFFLVVGVLAIVVITATLEIVPIMIGAIAGSLILVLTNCLTMKDFYESIEWKVIFLLAGALSLGVAMENSGLADIIASSLIQYLGQWGPIAIVSGLYLITSLLTEVMSNNATAALLAPIAIVTANSLGLSPIPFLMSITFAASASFMTPIGYQTNTMIYGVGQYKFMDFLRIGSWLNLLFWIIATLLIPIIYPFK